jgi:hypothetical protein
MPQLVVLSQGRIVIISRPTSLFAFRKEINMSEGLHKAGPVMVLVRAPRRRTMKGRAWLMHFDEFRDSDKELWLVLRKRKDNYS